ncbi:hypothetical protein HHL19_35465 [Streptomyces sp. R302]|uniref:hypothetical protein n=1 Tax=unclassified Streptomyces TaxID=2593676 RepID=UPI00145F8DEC|nr:MULTISPECIES: hypothetical protein [unclassified Streptomyces]NML55159.1 hypothetical protein [Streptomyces sp. R301]NML83811.1 hypothetical protein [Streptomyces sp. R302]
MTTQQTQAENGISHVDSRGRVGREAVGLLLLSLGVLGVLLALATWHWLAALIAAHVGLIACGVIARRTSSSRFKQDLGTIVACSSCGGLIPVLFGVAPTLGWLAVSLLAVAAGLWLSSSRVDEEA